MSYDLIALLTRNYTSHMVVALPEGPRLSREPANLLNIHSAKYSPLANAKTVGVMEKDGRIVIGTKDATGDKAQKPIGSIKSVTLKKSNARKAAHIAAGAAAKSRPDLRAVAVARASILSKTTNPPKSAKGRSARGKKASSA